MIDYLQKTMLESRAAEKQTADEMEQQLWEFVRQWVTILVLNRKQYKFYFVERHLITFVSLSISTLNVKQLYFLKC